MAYQPRQRPNFTELLPRPAAPTKRRRWLVVLAAVLVLVTALIFWGSTELGAPGDHSRQPNQATTQTPGAKNSVPAFNKQLYSLDDPDSLWVVVNKQRPLNPKNYAPSLAKPNVALRLNANSAEMQLRPETAEAVESLFADAKEAGLSLMIASAYRSHDVQVVVYANEVKAYGQAQADSQSARPGHSEHQTGWALDVEPSSRKCELDACFGDTPEGQWLAANAHSYGFVIRYPKDKSDVTGYIYEPWHIRYVGTVLAAEMHRQSVQTLEEFFGLPAAPSY